MASTDDRSVCDLLNELSEQTSTLVRQELELAEPRCSRRASRPAWAPGCSRRRALRLLALIALTGCLIMALDRVVVDWLAALVVTAAWAAIPARAAGIHVRAGWCRGTPSARCSCSTMVSQPRLEAGWGACDRVCGSRRAADAKADRHGLFAG
ncbi:MAG: hypothetical protein LC674_01075 [Actinobacteria bacterium]|nr:hypothetical protein [Actinomycetota bacterium]